MSQNKISRKTYVLISLLIVVLLGVCFTTVAIYAKHEMNKPKFTLPESPTPTIAELEGADKAAAFDYIAQQMNDIAAADDVEGSFHTNVRFKGDLVTPFSDADTSVLTYIRDRADKQIQSYLPSANNVVMRDAENFPIPVFTADDVTDFEIREGKIKDKGDEDDDDEFVDDARYYYVTFTVDPARADASGIPDGDVMRSVAQELSPAMSLSGTQFDTQSVTAGYIVDRLSGKIVKVTFARVWQVRTNFTLTDTYRALSANAQGEITTPVEATQIIDFKHCGAIFTERAIAVNPDDMKALPAEVTLHSNMDNVPYTLSFTSSVPDALTFDADGVMTVEKLTDDPVTVTMTLDCGGHTYSDTLSVYITQWEVDTGEQ